ALIARLTRATCHSSSLMRPDRGNGRHDKPIYPDDISSLACRASAAQEPPDPLPIGPGDLHGSRQPPGTPRRLVLQQVALASLLGLELAAAGHLDPLTHAGVGLHLRHYLQPFRAHAPALTVRQRCRTTDLGPTLPTGGRPPIRRHRPARRRRRETWARCAQACPSYVALSP